MEGEAHLAGCRAGPCLSHPCPCSQSLGEVGSGLLPRCNLLVQPLSLVCGPCRGGGRWVLAPFPLSWDRAACRTQAEHSQACWPISLQRALLVAAAVLGEVAETCWTRSRF